MKEKWSTLTPEEKMATLDARNKKLAPRTEDQTSTGPEPGLIHEDDRELFEMLDKRMAAYS